MLIEKITIQNFKSIDKIDLDIKKIGNSFTRMLVGINESGKSNILEAISFFTTHEKEFDYNEISNQKNENTKSVNLFFDLIFENTNIYLKEFRDKTQLYKIDFKIKKVIKQVYLNKNEKKFQHKYEYDISINSKLDMKRSTETKIIDNKSINKDVYKFFVDDNIYGTEKVTVDFFISHFKNILDNILEKHEPKVSFWQPSHEYLISSCNLYELKKDINSNIPIKNIFRLSGYSKDEDIIEQIDNILHDQKRSKLESIINTELNKHIKNIWKHKIDIVVNITETGRFSLSIKDEGPENKHDRFSINARSEGAKHFLSLILSLSAEIKNGIRQNQLILVDEPEIHLHPSGIRDMKDELLKIGEENYLFVSTHSPFLIDRKNKERNIIVKKNDKAQTTIKEIKEEDDIRGDEVLREAFGINIYQDLLNPHRILLEGASDKKILDKLFQAKDTYASTTNGHGSNIDTTASMFNGNNISIIVIVDDDNEGKKYKDKILKIGGVYSDKNVFTLKDLVYKMTDDGTIEDLLNKDFIENKFKEFYKSKYEEDCNIIFNNNPFIEQIKVFLHQNNKPNIQNVLDEFKIKISNELTLTKTNLSQKFPLLDDLYKSVYSKLKVIK